MFKVENSRFAIKRKPLASSYKNTKDTVSYFLKNRSSSSSVIDLSTFTDGSKLDRYFKSPGTYSEERLQLSNALYDTNKVYAAVIDYLSNIYYMRYTVIPRKIKFSGDKLSKQDYMKMYNSMLEFVDGISIETVFPSLLNSLLKNGQIYIYVKGDNVSKTLSTILLPNKYCKTTFATQFGTQEIAFDFSFFDSLGLKNSDLEELFTLFPEEFKDLYSKYKTDTTNKRWQSLNGKRATSIALNSDGFPTFLNIFYDLIDYKTYKMNELDRNSNQLERIVSQEIDMEKTDLDLPEVQDLHDSMAEVLCASKGTTLVTTVGKLDVHQLQEDLGQENKVLSNAYKSIYDNAGFNNELFTGDTDYSLETSLKRDLAYMWNFIQKLESFYNLAINNIKNFKNYQLSLKMLPISPYNEAEKCEIYHQAATLGVNVLDYIVAVGTKQVDLESTIELEEFLDLPNRLTPLQSSHTQSSSVLEEPKSEEKEEEDKDAPSDPSKEDEEPKGQNQDSNIKDNEGE